MELRKFDFQRWPAYEKALLVIGRINDLCGRLERDTSANLRDQLRRASQSIPLNIAEGSARYTSRDKANFFRIARGSVFECVAILDVIRSLELAKGGFSEMYTNLEQIARMLSGLINYVESERYKTVGTKPSVT